MADDKQMQKPQDYGGRHCKEKKHEPGSPIPPPACQSHCQNHALMATIVKQCLLISFNIAIENRVRNDREKVQELWHQAENLDELVTLKLRAQSKSTLIEVVRNIRSAPRNITAKYFREHILPVDLQSYINKVCQYLSDTDHTDWPALISGLIAKERRTKKSHSTRPRPTTSPHQNTSPRSNSGHRSNTSSHPQENTGPCLHPNASPPSQQNTSPHVHRNTSLRTQNRANQPGPPSKSLSKVLTSKLVKDLADSKSNCKENIGLTKKRSVNAGKETPCIPQKSVKLVVDGSGKVQRDVHRKTVLQTRQKPGHLLVSSVQHTLGGVKNRALSASSATVQCDKALPATGLGKLMDEEPPARAHGRNVSTNSGNLQRKPLSSCSGRVEHKVPSASLGKECETISKTSVKVHNKALTTASGKVQDQTFSPSLGQEQNKTLPVSSGKAQNRTLPVPPVDKLKKKLFHSKKQEIIVNKRSTTVDGITKVTLKCKESSVSCSESSDSSEITSQGTSYLSDMSREDKRTTPLIAKAGELSANGVSLSECDDIKQHLQEDRKTLSDTKQGKCLDIIEADKETDVLPIHKTISADEKSIIEADIGTDVPPICKKNISAIEKSIVDVTVFPQSADKGPVSPNSNSGLSIKHDAELNNDQAQESDSYVLVLEKDLQWKDHEIVPLPTEKDLISLNNSIVETSSCAEVNVLTADKPQKAFTSLNNNIENSCENDLMNDDLLEGTIPIAPIGPCEVNTDSVVDDHENITGSKSGGDEVLTVGGMHTEEAVVLNNNNETGSSTDEIQTKDGHAEAGSPETKEIAPRVSVSKETSATSFPGYHVYRDNQMSKSPTMESPPKVPVVDEPRTMSQSLSGSGVSPLAKSISTISLMSTGPTAVHTTAKVRKCASSDGVGDLESTVSQDASASNVNHNVSLIFSSAINIARKNLLEALNNTQKSKLKNGNTETSFSLMTTQCKTSNEKSETVSIPSSPDDLDQETSGKQTETTSNPSKSEANVSLMTTQFETSNKKSETASIPSSPDDLDQETSEKQTETTNNPSKSKTTISLITMQCESSEEVPETVSIPSIPDDLDPETIKKQTEAKSNPSKSTPTSPVPTTPNANVTSASTVLLSPLEHSSNRTCLCIPCAWGRALRLAVCTESMVKEAKDLLTCSCTTCLEKSQCYDKWIGLIVSQLHKAKSDINQIVQNKKDEVLRHAINNDLLPLLKKLLPDIKNKWQSFESCLLEGNRHELAFESFKANNQTDGLWTVIGKYCFCRQSTGNMGLEFRKQYFNYESPHCVRNHSAASQNQAFTGQFNGASVCSQNPESRSNGQNITVSVSKPLVNSMVTSRKGSFKSQIGRLNELAPSSQENDKVPGASRNQLLQSLLEDDQPAASGESSSLLKPNSDKTLQSDLVTERRKSNPERISSKHPTSKAPVSKQSVSFPSSVLQSQQHVKQRSSAPLNNPHYNMQCMSQSNAGNMPVPPYVPSHRHRLPTINQMPNAMQGVGQIRMTQPNPRAAGCVHSSAQNNASNNTMWSMQHQIQSNYQPHQSMPRLGPPNPSNYGAIPRNNATFPGTSAHFQALQKTGRHIPIKPSNNGVRFQAPLGQPHPSDHSTASPNNAYFNGYSAQCPPPQQMGPPVTVQPTHNDVRFQAPVSGGAAPCPQATDWQMTGYPNAPPARLPQENTNWNQCGRTGDNPVSVFQSRQGASVPSGNAKHPVAIQPSVYQGNGQTKPPQQNSTRQEACKKLWHMKLSKWSEQRCLFNKLTTLVQGLPEKCISLDQLVEFVETAWPSALAWIKADNSSNSRKIKEGFLLTLLVKYSDNFYMDENSSIHLVDTDVKRYLEQNSGGKTSNNGIGGATSHVAQSASAAVEPAVRQCSSFQATSVLSHVPSNGGCLQRNIHSHAQSNDSGASAHNNPGLNVSSALKQAELKRQNTALHQGHHQRTMLPPDGQQRPVPQGRSQRGTVRQTSQRPIRPDTLQRPGPDNSKVYAGPQRPVRQDVTQTSVPHTDELTSVQKCMAMLDRLPEASQCSKSRDLSQMAIMPQNQRTSDLYKADAPQIGERPAPERRMPLEGIQSDGVRSAQSAQPESAAGSPRSAEKRCLEVAAYQDDELEIPEIQPPRKKLFKTEVSRLQHTSPDSSPPHISLSRISGLRYSRSSSLDDFRSRNVSTVGHRSGSAPVPVLEPAPVTAALKLPIRIIDEEDKGLQGDSPVFVDDELMSMFNFGNSQSELESAAYNESGLDLFCFADEEVSSPTHNEVPGGIVLGSADEATTSGECSSFKSLLNFCRDGPTRVKERPERTALSTILCSSSDASSSHRTNSTSSIETGPVSASSKSSTLHEASSATSRARVTGNTSSDADVGPSDVEISYPTGGMRLPVALKQSTSACGENQNFLMLEITQDGEDVVQEIPLSDVQIGTRLQYDYSIFNLTPDEASVEVDSDDGFILVEEESHHKAKVTPASEQQRELHNVAVKQVQCPRAKEPTDDLKVMQVKRSELSKESQNESESTSSRQASVPAVDEAKIPLEKDTVLKNGPQLNVALRNPKVGVKPLQEDTPNIEINVDNEETRSHVIKRKSEESYKSNTYKKKSRPTEAGNSTAEYTRSGHASEKSGQHPSSLRLRHSLQYCDSDSGISDSESNMATDAAASGPSTNGMGLSAYSTSELLQYLQSRQKLKWCDCQLGFYDKHCNHASYCAHYASHRHDETKVCNGCNHLCQDAQGLLVHWYETCRECSLEKTKMKRKNSHTAHK